MGTEVPNGSETTPISEENALLLMPPVSLDESGEGLPYAPVDWPKPGDNWGWRVGKRISLNGNYVDRYLYLPKRLRESESRKVTFASKLAVSRYIEAKFPDADVGAFFASFSWRIPAKRGALVNGHVKGRNIMSLPTDEQIEQSLLEIEPGGCKAGNKTCTSLSEDLATVTATTAAAAAATIDCDICCLEPRFCRECCCILCCKSVDSSSHGGYSFVRCEAEAEEGRLCGHIAHINCAMRSYMAGKVGGSIGLDAEYYCRRCDAKTDLVPHVSRMLEACESIESRDEVEKILKFGFGVLKGSERRDAKGLVDRIESAISKLDNGICLEDVWKVEDNSVALSTAMEIVADEQDHMDIHTDLPNLSAPFNWLTESLKLEDEISHVLQELRRSQEMEYKIAEDRLFDQKSYLTSLYQQLEIERSELTRNDQNDQLSTVMSRMNQIKHEVSKLKDMGQVAKGFGKASRVVLTDHFGLDIED